MRQPDCQAGALGVCRQEAGYNRKELLQFILAIFLVVELVLAMILGGLLGDEVAGVYTGGWRTVVFGIVGIAGTVASFLTFLIGFGCLYTFLRQSEVPKAPHDEKDRPHIS